MAVAYQLLFPSGKSYIGIASDFKARMRAHKTSAAKGGYAVHKAIAKFGWESVEKIVIAEGSFEEMKEAEVFFIATLETKTPRGYNLTDGGDGTTGAKKTEKEVSAIRTRMIGNRNTLGKRYSKEESVALFGGWKHTEAHKALMSQKMKGRVLSEETKEKIRAAAQARWKIDAQRAAASVLAKERCARPGMKEKMIAVGKKIVHTEAQKRKHSADLRAFHSEAKAGLHSLSLGEWFARRKASA